MNVAFNKIQRNLHSHIIPDSIRQAKHQKPYYICL